LEENLNNEEEHDDIVSGSHKSHLTGKDLILVNLSKLLIEFVGTATMAIFYLLLGD